MADRTESSITISAEPAAIMDVIADLEAYPEWTNDVKEVEVLTVYEDGRTPGGGALRHRLRRLQGRLHPRVRVGRRPARVVGHGHAGLAAQGHGRCVRPHRQGDGSTEVVYQLAVDVKIPMLGMIKRKAEKVIVDTALKGLKARVEG